MAIVHISEAEAAKDFPGLLSRVREGAEVVIDDETGPVAVMRSPEGLDPSMAATMARALRLRELRGEDLYIDSDFAADVAERIRNRKPRDRSAYE